MGAQWLNGWVLDSRPRGCRFEPHCVVSLSKTHLSLLSTGSTQEDLSRHKWKIVDWDEKIQIKPQRSRWLKFGCDAEAYVNKYWVSFIRRQSSEKHKTLCPMGNFHAYLLSDDFFKINFFEKFFQEYHLSVKHFVGPDLGLNCLQKLSTDCTRR